MDDKELQDLNLEDIMREFGWEEPDDLEEFSLPDFSDESEEPSASEEEVSSAEEGACGSVPEEKPEETEPAASQQEAGSPETEPEYWEEAEPEEVIVDTIHLEAVEKAVNTVPLSDDTLVLHLVEDGETEEARNASACARTESEPFSEEWEPEYEEPIADYVPRQPIEFRPKNRMRELRQKLVAGPEKRFYDLSELGVGKLQAGIFLTFLIFAVSTGVTVLFEMGMIGQERLRLLIFVQMLALLLSGLLGCYRLMDGVWDLFHLRFSLDTLLVVTFAVCCADGVFSLWDQRIPCCAVFCLEMTMAQWAAYERRNIEMDQMDTLRRATELTAVVRSDDFYEQKPAYLTKEGELESFTDNYTKRSAPEKVLSIYALSGMAVSIGLGVLAGVRHGLHTGIQVTAAALMIAMPATGFISMSRPAAILEKRLHRLGTVLCGWKGIRAVGKKAVYPLNNDDLFPAGTAKLNGVKFYGTNPPDMVVAYMDAVMQQDGGPLVPLFRQLLASRKGWQYQADNLVDYPGGIAATVNEDCVLIGSLEFMKDMGVKISEGITVAQAVYIAIEKELSGVFAITYSRSKSAASGLRTLCGYRNLTPVAVSGGFMMTEDFIRSKFSANVRHMIFPTREVRKNLSEITPAEDAPVIALTMRDGLAQKAFAVTGARSLRTALTAGVVIHMLGGILGLAAVGVLAWLGTTHMLTAANLLLYGLIWMIPGLLVTEWTRFV